MSDTFLAVLITALFVLDFAALLLAWSCHKAAEAEAAGRDKALAGWRYSQDHWEESLKAWRQDMDRRNVYEAALRRELATLRARKRRGIFHNRDEFDRVGWFGATYDNGELLYSHAVRRNADRWRKDRTEGNWGKYLQREKEVRKCSA